MVSSYLLYNLSTINLNSETFRFPYFLDQSDKLGSPCRPKYVKNQSVLAARRAFSGQIERPEPDL